MALASNEKRIKNTVLAVVALVAASASVACGGDDSKSTGDSYWPGAYDPAGQPAPSSVVTYHGGNAHPGACMTGACHGPAGTAALKLAYGGVVYQADGATPAGNVQIGVSDGAYKSHVYSASNGYYWAPAAGATAINWGGADIRIRNIKGERPKLPEHDRNGDCDTCHTPALGLPLKVLP